MPLRWEPDATYQIASAKVAALEARYNCVHDIYPIWTGFEPDSSGLTFFIDEIILREANG
jgi:hypothetical protein